MKTEQKNNFHYKVRQKQAKNIKQKQAKNIEKKARNTHNISNCYYINVVAK